MSYVYTKFDGICTDMKSENNNKKKIHETNLLGPVS